MQDWSTEAARSTGEAASRARVRRGGFTLLEMILVLAVAALMMGVAASAMMRSESGSARARRGLADVVMHLREARADAMVRRETVVVELRRDAGRGAGAMVLARTGGDRGDRAVDMGSLWLLDATGMWAESARVGFDSSGRSDARGWRFAEREGSRSGRIAWLIVFDPVSGEARLAEGDGTVAGEERWGEGAAELAP